MSGIIASTAKPRSTNTLLRELLSLLGPMRRALAFSITMRILHQALNMAFLVVAVGGTMEVLKGGGAMHYQLWWLAGWLIGIGLVKGACRYLEQFSGHYVAFHLLASLRNKLFEKLERLAPAGLGTDRSGDLLSRAIADIECIEVFYAHTLAPVVAAAIVPWIAVAGIAVFSLPLAACVIFCLLIVGMAIPLITRLGANPVALASRQAAAEMSAQFTDGLLGLRELLAMRAEERSIAAMGLAAGKLEKAQRGLALWGAFQNTGTTLFIGVATIAAIVTGSILGTSGTLSVYDFPVVIVLVMSAFFPLLGLGNLIPDLEQALGSAHRIFEMLDRVEPNANTNNKSRGSLISKQPSGVEVCFDKVSFSYSQEDPLSERVLHEVSFCIRPGEIFAVTGSSGSGKSTLLNLLARFWLPDSGRILLNGIDIQHIDEAELRRCFSIVSQRPHIFQVTLRENLLLANPDAKEKDIIRALRLASLDDWIASLPDGLDTQAGSLGGRLSGGQRQRLAMARAFLKEAPVLVLDEATSSLDAGHEQAVQQAVRRWMNEVPDNRRSVILISHRVDSLLAANRIAVMADGHVLQIGSHQELASVNGTYSELLAT